MSGARPPGAAGAAPAGESSYLRYLPPVLWATGPDPADDEDPADPAGVTLGSVLRIVEKVLTGIDDGVATASPPIARSIDALPGTYDPWTTPAEFLPWLASWVALEFPTLRGEPTWPEYQRRKVTAEIARIYRRRGLRAGLDAYIDLYATGRTKPRVALDDGTRLFAVVPSASGPASAHALLAQGPVVVGTAVRAEGPTRPWCVATGSDGSILLGDIGIPAGAAITLRSRTWRLDAAGHVDRAGAPPVPQPLAGATLPLTRAVAATVVPGAGGTPETLYVLDRNGKLFAVPGPWTPASTAGQVLTLAAPGTTVFPVAMAADPATGELLVLDRGDGPGTPNPPRVITVHPGTGAVGRHPLTSVIEPLSLWVEADGSLLVGDGGDQAPSGPEGMEGAIVHVDRAAGWRQSPLLRPGHGLVAPTGIARLDDGRLYVLDAGLKPFAPSPTEPFVCAVADPAAIHEVDPPGAGRQVTRITEPGLMVYPTGMAAAGDRLLVCDPGQPDVAGLQPFWSRVRPFTVDVVVHFVRSRLPQGDAARQRVLSQAVGDLRAVIEAQKPAHTVWNLITAI